MGKFVKVNNGKLIPLEDYLDIKARQYGFDDYEDLRKNGMSLEIPETVDTAVINLGNLYHTGINHLFFGGEIRNGDGYELYDERPPKDFLFCDLTEVIILDQTDHVVTINVPRTDIKILFTKEEFNVATEPVKEKTEEEVDYDYGE